MSVTVAVDDGYAQTKLVGDAPGGGPPLRFLARSSVRPGRYALASLSGDGTPGSYRTEEGEDYTVSDDVEGESTRFDGFHTSPMNRVLVHHALRGAGYGGQKVRLVVGLPVADFFSGVHIDKAKVSAKKENLLREVRHAGGERMAQIAEVKVGCQAIAAFFDHLLDEDLKEREEAPRVVAVVDVGGRTTDIAVVIDGESFDPARSGTADIGVLDVYAAVSDGLRAKFGLKDRYPLAVLDRAVRERKVRLWGKDVDVEEVVSEAVREQEAKVAREVERRLGSAASVDLVLFVGGGSALFSGVASRFPNGSMADDPEFANARGLRKYVRYFDGAG